MKRLMLLAALLFSPGIAASGEPIGDVGEIVRRANQAQYYAGDDGRAEVRMTILDSQGRRQLRQFTMLRKDVSDGGDQRYLAVFSYPADVRLTVFLVQKHVDGDDDRWLYLPGLDLVKRIAAGDKRTSFVGSHFFYEDISGRGVDRDAHKLIETTQAHYVVRNVPKRPENVEFSEYTVWIDRTTFLPMKAEYTNPAGKVYRRMEVLNVKRVDGYPTPTKVRMSDLANGGETVNEFRYIDYDIGVPDTVFSERSLRRPPREWLQRRVRP